MSNIQSQNYNTPSNNNKHYTQQGYQNRNYQNASTTQNALPQQIKKNESLEAYVNNILNDASLKNFIDQNARPYIDKNIFKSMCASYLVNAHANKIFRIRPSDIQHAIKLACIDGVYLDGIHSYLLVNYLQKNNKGSNIVASAFDHSASLSVMKSGLVYILFNNTDIVKISAKCVFFSDEFDVNLADLNSSITHKKNKFLDESTHIADQIFAAYCVAKDKSGEIYREVIFREELLEGLKKAKLGDKAPESANTTEMSEAKPKIVDNSPWAKHTIAMCEAKAIRKMILTMPVKYKMGQSILLDDIDSNDCYDGNGGTPDEDVHFENIPQN